MAIKPMGMKAIKSALDFFSIWGQRQKKFITSLSGRLLFLTLGFVFVVEIIIIIPSMAAFQYNWLSERITNAEIASLAIEVSDTKTVSRDLSATLLSSAGVSYLAIQNDGVRDIVLRDPDSVVPEEVMDLRRTNPSIFEDIRYLYAPWSTFFSKDTESLYYQTRPRVREGQIIEVVVPVSEIKSDLKSHLINILRISLGVSVAAGLIVFYALMFSIVRPIQSLTGSIAHFRADPEHEQPSLKINRRDEIGIIAKELAIMQDEVRHALRSKARLAALGQAVSKINHDLRNMLTSARMASDRLAQSPDPVVTKSLPRLERALDRAMTLAQNVLNYGRSDEDEPKCQWLKLKPLVMNAAEDAGLAIGRDKSSAVRFVTKMPASLTCEADPDQLHRLLVNLMRNARQALEHQAHPPAKPRVLLEVLKTSEHIELRLSDNGPGIPPKLKDTLFQPFTGTTTPGGAGLGLAIARELIERHGGELLLESTSPRGTSFLIRWPQRP